MRLHTSSRSSSCVFRSDWDVVIILKAAPEAKIPATAAQGSILKCDQLFDGSVFVFVKWPEICTERGPGNGMNIIKFNCKC
jgi:hypothetical protein